MQLVTIGLTTFNAIDTLERAVQSALKQTWKNIEIIAVDDCSTDGTLEKLNYLSSKFSQIKVFSNTKNSGVAVSRNRVINEAKGEFIAFFDDDDFSFPERISEQYDRIIKYEKDFSRGAMVICHAARIVRYGDRDRHEKTLGEKLYKMAPAGINVAQRILFGQKVDDGYGACATCSQMARLSTYRALNGFDAALRRSEDTEFNIRLALAGGHFVGIAKPLVLQFMTKTNEKSITEEYENLLYVYRKHYSIFNNQRHFDFNLSWLNAKYLFLDGKTFSFIFLLLNLFIRFPILFTNRCLVAIPNMEINLAYKNFYLKDKE